MAVMWRADARRRSHARSYVLRMPCVLRFNMRAPGSVGALGGARPRRICREAARYRRVSSAIFHAASVLQDN